MTPVRMITLGTIVAVSILSSAYTLGRSMAGHPDGRPAGFAADASPDGGRRSAADGASGTGTAPVPTHPAATRTPDARLPQLPAEAGGPFGARQTTGTSDVALTFDDGPDPTWTPQVLALLRAAGVQATFCLVGSNAQQHPDLVRAIAADGHTLCNHSWSHDLRLGTRSPAVIRDELNRTTSVIQAAVPGARIAYFRAPGGNWNPTLVTIARQLGMTSLHWAVDPRDWERPGSQAVVDFVASGTVAGSIVLLHDGGGDRGQTVAALGKLLPELRQRFQLRSLPTGPRAQTPPP
ncbi:MAG TPA: polysaccharide deacetylase family protein [Micromonospora sp.]